MPIAVKIVNKNGDIVPYNGTYDGSSTLITNSSQILMMYKDQGTYYDVICMGTDQTWTPGSGFTGYLLYPGVRVYGDFGARFTLLDENDNPLLSFGDTSYQGVAVAHLWIQKATLLLDLPTS